MSRRNPDTEISFAPSQNVIELVTAYAAAVLMPAEDEQGNRLEPLPPIIDAAQILACAFLHGIGLLAKAHRHAADAKASASASWIHDGLESAAKSNRGLANVLDRLSAAIERHANSVAAQAEAKATYELECQLAGALRGLEEELAQENETGKAA